MRVVLLHGDNVVRDRTFDDGPITIGADATSSVHLPDLRMPLEHARLVTASSGQWHVQITNAALETAVNGRPFDKRCPIYNGDEISVGNFRLKVAVDPGCDLGVAGASSLDELARIKDYPLPPGGEVRQADRPLEIPLERQRYLVRFARELATCRDVESLLDVTLKVMRHVFKPGLAWCGARIQPIGGLGIVEGRTRDGISARAPQALSSLSYRCLERGQSVLLARKRSRHQECGLATPLDAVRGRLGLLYVEGNPDEHRYRAEHLDLLMALASYVAYRLEDILIGAVPPPPQPTPTTVPAPSPPDTTPPREPAAKSSNAPADARPVIAAGTRLRDIQAALNPTTLPRWPGCEVTVLWKPGRGGAVDVHDLMTMPNGVASVLVASVDAAPTRCPIALAEVQAAFRVSGLHADPPRTLLRELNWLSNSHHGQRCTMAAAHVALNPNTGATEFCTAGPIGALILEPQGVPRILTDPDAGLLGEGQPIDPPRRTETLRAGEMLALFTPGCQTVMDADGHALGQDRFVETLTEQLGTPTPQALEALQHDLASFFKDGTQPDDITILLLYRP